MTKIQIAQYAANFALSAAITDKLEDVITTNTDHTEDDLSVRVASNVGGMLIANKFRAQTDAAVVKAAEQLTKIRTKFTK